MKNILTVMAIAAIVSLSSCGMGGWSKPEPEVITPTTQPPLPGSDGSGIELPVSYGNGVHYFKTTSYSLNDFGKSLASFLSDTSIVLVTMSPEADATGQTLGFWVVVKKK